MFDFQEQKQTSPNQLQAIFCGPSIARKYGVSQSLQRAALHTSNVKSVDSKLKVTCWVGVKADQDNLQRAPITNLIPNFPLHIPPSPSCVDPY